MSGPTVPFASEDDVPIRYMDRTREYYQTLGFSPYRWAHFADAPFTPLATPLARALGIEFEDTYKKYMRLGDPDQILADATPCMAANGVDPAVARGLVLKTLAPR